MRACARRSGASTQRVISAYDSDVHAGHCCASWTSSQSRQRRAFRSFMTPVYSTRAMEESTRDNPVNARTNSKLHQGGPPAGE